MSLSVKVLLGVMALLLGARSIAWSGPAKSDSRVFPHPAHVKVLPNGLTVVSVPFDSPGLVAWWTVVRTGSRNEIEPGKSGFAHFFEHMMFRGTERYSREKYNAVLKELGADHNAFTSDDLTAYHILAPSSALDTLMTLESDRFMNLKYSEEDFKKEAGAVLGEYNKNASSPFLILHETVRDAAFTTHTYKHTTMGFLADIKEMPNQYAYSLAFFDRWYRPENCILLAVGDVDPAEVVRLASSHYGAWKKGTYRLKLPVEPPQKGEKRADIPWPNPTQPYLEIAWHGPGFSTDNIDMPALDVVSQLLFSQAAPLYQKLVVEDQSVDFMFGGARDHRDPNLFEVVTRVKDEDRVSRVEQAIVAALEDLKKTPVDAARLERVKAHLKYSFAMGLDTADSVAGTLAHFLALTGDPQTVNRVYVLYDRITPADIQAVARKYFVDTSRTVLTLRYAPPAPKDEQGAGEATGEGRPPAAGR